MRARLRHARNDPEGALEDMKKALSSDVPGLKSRFEHLEALSDIEAGMGMVSEAAQTLLEALSQEDSFTHAAANFYRLKNLEAILEKMCCGKVSAHPKRNGEAISAVSAMAASFPENGALREGLGVLLMEGCRSAEAATCFEDAIRLGGLFQPA